MKRAPICVVLCGLLVAVMLAGCGASQAPAPPVVDTREQDEAAIRAAAQDWGLAIAAKNLDETLSFYADDAWVYPQDAPAAKTAEQRRAVWAEFFAIPNASNMEGDIGRVEIARSGDLAVQFGAFAMSMIDKSGKPVIVNEKSIVTWKKQSDGTWKVIGDIWNKDK